MTVFCVHLVTLVDQPQTGPSGVVRQGHRVVRGATATFRGVHSIIMEKLAQDSGGTVHARPLSLYLPVPLRTKLWCALPLFLLYTYITYKITPCCVPLLLPARKAAVLGQPSRLRNRLRSPGIDSQPGGFIPTAGDIWDVFLGNNVFSMV
jgi:hypothetical protein